MEKGFWEKLPKPIIGLAPMDGVTDAAFRFMVAKYGKPHVIMTEFTSVEGVCHGATKPLKAFLFDESERPISAQLFGSDPQSFYKTALLICELGFDGIDINMGCPAKNVATKGAGAGLIQTPELAKEIIRASKQGTRDWAAGKKIEECELPDEIIAYVKKKRPKKLLRRELPVSVKTRIGYDRDTAEEWIKHLLEEKPVNISIHGRTLKQMYSGQADWEAIARAAKLIHQTETIVMGNGDIGSVKEGMEKVKQYGVDGFLIGRACFGNPGIFSERDGEPNSYEQGLLWAIEHAKLYEKMFPDDHFIPMRKHLAWYCRGFPGASEIRQKLMSAESAKDVEEMLMDFTQNQG